MKHSLLLGCGHTASDTSNTMDIFITNVFTYASVLNVYEEATKSENSNHCRINWTTSWGQSFDEKLLVTLELLVAVSIQSQRHNNMPDLVLCRDIIPLCVQANKYVECIGDWAFVCSLLITTKHLFSIRTTKMLTGTTWKPCWGVHVEETSSGAAVLQIN